jgi:hypothetical protein
MTKDLLSENEETRRKKYVDFVMSLDDKYEKKNNKENMKKLDDIDLNIHAKKLEQEYLEKYGPEKKTKKSNIFFMKSTNNPNVYRDTLYILLQQELMRQYHIKGSFSKILPDDLKTIKPLSLTVKKKVEISMEIDTSLYCHCLG